MNQSALTLVTPIIADKQERLNAILIKLRTGLDSGSFRLFEEITTIHYARFVLLKNQLSNNKQNLVFSSDYDGTESEHLLTLSSSATGMIDELYENCEGYPLPSERTAATRQAYLQRWVTKEASFYIGAPERTVQQIKRESDLRNYIWSILHTESWRGKTALEVHDLIKIKVLANEKYQWVNERIILPKVRWYGHPWVQILIAFLLLPLTFLILLFVLIWILVIHFRFEKKDKPLGLTPSQIEEDHVKSLEEYEDVHNQNQFTQIIAMKPGKMRLYTLKALMAYARFRVNAEFRLGKLMGIPTIHFARWVIFDNDKQVLFFSNFDGSWQQYLGDFIDKSGWGLTAIFSNTKDFPKTRFVFWGGAYDEEHFLAWARYTQIPTAVWYCAYPHLSIKNINNNSAVRFELMKNLTEEQAQIFLNRF